MLKLTMIKLTQHMEGKADAPVWIASEHIVSIQPTDAGTLVRLVNRVDFFVAQTPLEILLRMSESESPPVGAVTKAAS